MPRSAWWLLVLLVLWTGYVWVTRLFNAWSSTEESTSAKVVSTLISLIFLAFVVAGVVILAQTWSGGLEGWMQGTLAAFAVWTAGVWIVRIVMISLADHTTGFKVVHVALGLISIALATAVAWTASTADA